MPSPVEIILGFLVIAVLMPLAYAKKYLSKSGVIAGGIIGSIVLVSGGLGWLILMVLFMVSGSIATRLHKGSEHGKKAYRGLRNVLANGLPPLIFAGLYIMRSGEPLWSLAYAASIVSATSDTLSTEFGLFSASLPRRISRPSVKVVKGTSGGVTATGIVAGIVAAVLMSFAAVSLRVVQPKAFLLLVFSGFLGNCMDSLLGDIVQAKYYCDATGATVESKEECPVPASLVSGVPNFNNHVVNFTANVFAGALAVALAVFTVYA